MIPRKIYFRRALNIAVYTVSVLASLIGILALFWILFEVVQRGFSAIDWAFFTELPTPPGMAGGGVANALLGSAIISVIAALIGIPVGMFSGVYLSEFGRHTRFGKIVKFSVDTMMGIPSIIIGLFIYAVMVKPLGHFSGYAGGLALAILMLPVVAGTTADILSLVPDSLRESALALGAPRWRVIMGVVFRMAKRGLITGVLLAFARVSGETAPLLFTALNSPFWPSSINEPTANLTVTIFNYAMSPYDDWQRIAWGASMLIVVVILAITLIARLFLRERKPI